MADVLSSPSPSVVSGLRPFSIGELADRCFQLYRRHFIPLFYFSALIQAFPFSLSLILAFFGRNVQISDLMTHPENLTWFLCRIFLSLVLLTLGEAALTDYVARLYLGKSVSVRSSLATMSRRSPAVLWSTALKYFLIFLAFLPCVIPIVIGQSWRGPLSVWMIAGLSLAGFILFMPWLILAVRYLVMMQAVMLEKVSGLAALRRSSEIIRYNLGKNIMQWGETRISLILLVIGVANILVIIASHLPQLVATAGEMLRGNLNPDSITLSPVIMTATDLLNFLGSALLAPLYVIGGTLFYYDVRVRKEAYDLELLAASLKPQTTAVPGDLRS
ncbi:MAG: hypothetical protein B9S32_05405 [Verrucomicrobia bacterium Tous-C9LFEB]|nr:MAG: hypothetical protein B9S32_05405 [Verrucomicrobia bacterium Tous-C9LFEB]